MKIDIDGFRVAPGRKLRLARTPTKAKSHYRSDEDYEKSLASQKDDLDALQQRLYAADRHSVLVILQAMDAAGKDGVLRHVMSGLNPQGCQVFSFKHPSAEELDHDFMWRYSKSLPERGRIGIFNRSYFEEVLVVRVHPEILRAQKIPDEHIQELDTVWKSRFRTIRQFERHLHHNGTRIVKLFLHVSKKEQARRFVERIDDASKNWKFNLRDVEERKYWDDYMQAFEACMRETSTAEAPWYVVPADDKKNARLIAAQILLETLRRLKPEFPKVDAKHRRELLALRAQLLK